MVLNDGEKIGGLPVMGYEVENFLNCIVSNELYHVQFKCTPFTWRNGRTGSDCIFERLDRSLVNSVFQYHFNIMQVEHLPRTGSDHALLVFSCDNRKLHS